MRFAACCVIVALLGSVVPASARQAPVLVAQQAFPLPPADIPQDGDGPVIIAQDSSAQLLRIDRLENQVRALTGQIEQMQFQQRKLEDALHKLQDNSAPPAANLNPGRVTPQGTTPVPRRPPTGDAFNPDANPNAPGVPRPLGQPYGLPQAQPAPATQAPASAPRQIVPQGPLVADDESDPSKPVEIVPGAVAAGPPRLADPLPGGLPRNPAANPPVVTGLLPGTQVQVPLAPQPQDDYNLGVSLYNQGQYAESETRLAAYLQKNPKGRFVPDALFYLGETYFQRQRQREAAEQYLKVSTDYSKSARAPNALVRLGMSLNAMGAKEQACATFGEVGRKYPDAAAAIRGAAREAARAKC